MVQHEPYFPNHSCSQQREGRRDTGCRSLTLRSMCCPGAMCCIMCTEPATNALTLRERTIQDLYLCSIYSNHTFANHLTSISSLNKPAPPLTSVSVHITAHSSGTITNTLPFHKDYTRKRCSYVKLIQSPKHTTVLQSSSRGR